MKKRKINPFERKVEKGNYGYFRAEKKRLMLITAILFGVPLFIFFSAWIYFKSRLTIWTVIATVGVLPGCKMLVTLILLLMRKPMDKEIYKTIRSHQGSLVMAYEMYMTFYEKSAFIDAFAICGNTVVGYSSDPKIDSDFMAAEAQKLIRKNGYKVDVKILKDIRPFLERLDSMNKNKESLESGLKFTPDPCYPDFDRNEMIRHTILNLCL
jgi:hypothetical protein